MRNVEQRPGDGQEPESGHADGMPRSRTVTEHGRRITLQDMSLAPQGDGPVDVASLLELVRGVERQGTRKAAVPGVQGSRRSNKNKRR